MLPVGEGGDSHWCCQKGSDITTLVLLSSLFSSVMSINTEYRSSFLKSLSVMGLDGRGRERAWCEDLGAKRASQDPRHDRCSLICSDLQQLFGASDEKIGK
ncbi:hypothetical protein GOODEAATRI_000041 [Goodea atripinnis]|uniref:Uncharacterized protein n=1 Tax=Goodea atripinnis TaxID=208336 RepID=A0ABV0NHT4_9TELE